MNSKWQSAAEERLGYTLTSLDELSGGDFARSYCASIADGIADGTRIFIKTHSNPPAGFFSTEAKGLTWLYDTQTVNIPQVLSVSDDPPYLALSWVEPGRAGTGTEQALGQQLAALHQCHQNAFGRADGATTGSLALPNQQVKQWPEFYATQRLLPLVEIAAQRNALPAGDLQSVEKIAGNLSSFNVPEEMPSLLHGDLWAGNRLVDNTGASWLIDPAAHCGHREFELGMMALFGGFDEPCFAAYHEAYPLVQGWQLRLPLHQLAPLLVHTIKFGGSYHGAVRSVIKKFE